MHLAIIAAASMVLGTVGLGAGAASAARDLPPLTLGEVNFHAMPTAQRGVDLYPHEALKARVEGHATVLCTVLQSGSMADCAVTEETPPGYGFGATLLENARTIRIYGQSRFGAATRGRLLEIPMKFTLPPGA